MDIQEAINIAYQMATGKKKQLNPGNARYERLLAIANMAASQWEAEPDVIWKSRCQRVEIDTVDPAERVYRLPQSVRTLETTRDVVLEKQGQRWLLPFVSYQQLRSGVRGVCLLGWSIEVGGITDEMRGADIIAPAVVRLPKMVQSTSKVLIDDPYWLVYMMAAEFVRNSRTKQNQYGNLIAMAQASMAGMKDRNMWKATEIMQENIWP